MLVRRGLFASHIYPVAKSPGGVFIKHPSSIPRRPFYCLQFAYGQFPYIAILPYSSTNFGTNANVFGIAESVVLANQKVPIPPIRTSTSRRTNLLPPSCHKAWIDIPVRCSEAPAMQPRDIIGEPDVCLVSLSPSLHAT